MRSGRSRVQRRQVYKSGTVFSIGPNTVRYIVLLLLAVFSLLYLVQSAQGSDKALELRSLEQQKIELDKELSTLEVNASRWQSVQNLTQSAEKQGLIPIGTEVETVTVDPADN